MLSILFLLSIAFLSDMEHNMEKKYSKKGALFLAVAAVIWGFAFVAQVSGSSDMAPFFFNFSRYLLGTLSVIPVILIFERGANDKKMLKTTVAAGVVTGAVLFIASFLQQYGIMLTDSAGKGGFITGLYMIFVPILGIFLGNRTSVLTWIGAVFGVVGLFLVCMGGGKVTITEGDFYLILCAVFFAVQILIIDHFGQRIYSLRFAMIEFATCMLLNFICALIFEDIALEPLKNAIIPVLYCGLMSVGIAYTFQIIGQKYCEPTSASIIMSTESVFSAIGGALLLNERMSASGYVGCVLIFAGILLSQARPRPNKKVKSVDAEEDGERRDGAFLK